jgi:hypothetical protein
MKNQNLALYLPEKYKVLVGNKTSKALCTCWFDILSVARNFTQIVENFAKEIGCEFYGSTQTRKWRGHIFAFPKIGEIYLDRKSVV